MSQRLVVAVVVAGFLSASSTLFAAEPRDPFRVTAAIDREISDRLTEKGIHAAPPASDAEFLRRVFLDLTGKIPSAERAEAFLDSTDSDKRVDLVNELLASPDYGRHFSIVWQNLILPEQSDIQFLAIVSIDGIKGFGRWLEDAFNRNRPWDEMARELITAQGTIPENPAVIYTMASLERAQVRPDLLGATTAKLFLGVQLQCVECHDHFFNPWKQQDFWGLAAFFGRTRFEVPTPVRPGTGGIAESAGNRRGRFVVNGSEITVPNTGGNKGAGKVVRAKFLGGSEPKLDDADSYRGTLAEWITSPDNPYFAPATVNRLWGHLFARGLVHPVDDMHAGHSNSNSRLLELLSREFRESGCDLKHLLRCLCYSQTYQRSSRSIASNPQDLSLGSHAPVKVISPDAFYDALLQVLEVKQLDLDLPETLRVLLPPAERDRLRFVRYFHARAAEADEFARGVPHALPLMNSEVFNTAPPSVRKVSHLPPEKAIERLYLTTLSRRPTAEERATMAKFLADRSSAGPAQNYAAVLWILVNCSEFALNH